VIRSQGEQGGCEGTEKWRLNLVTVRDLAQVSAGFVPAIPAFGDHLVCDQVHAVSGG
jgi:hypothetical protein